LSGRGLCDELITRPEESYRLCCVVVCDLETSRIGAPYIYDISNLRVNFLYTLNYRKLTKSAPAEYKLLRLTTTLQWQVNLFVHTFLSHHMR